jgi:deoxycytidine triphosphate deaminase
MLNNTEYIDYNNEFEEFYAYSKFKFAPGLANGDEIQEFLEAGFLKDVEIEKINATSIDLKLNDDFKKLAGGQIIDLTKGERPDVIQMKKEFDGKYVINPNMCFLGSTKGVYNLPNWLSTIVELRSSTGRMFINHMKAGWADPGFNNANLTLEFHNVSDNTYLIDSEQYLIQVVFQKSFPVSEKYDYRTKGNYNGVLGTVNSRGV